MFSSSRIWSAWIIQSSRRSATSSATQGSQTSGCPRRISITPLPPGVGHGGVGTQQIVIELANLLDRLFQFLVIVQPATNLSHPLFPHADLSRLSAPITDRQHVHLMALAARAFRTPALVTHDTLQQRSAQKLASNRQRCYQSLAFSKRAFTNHLRQ